MKALPLLSDSDKGSNNVEEENCHCSSSGEYLAGFYMLSSALPILPVVFTLNIRFFSICSLYIFLPFKLGCLLCKADAIKWECPTGILGWRALAYVQGCERYRMMQSWKLFHRQISITVPSFCNLRRIEMTYINSVEAKKALLYQRDPCHISAFYVSSVDIASAET